jgi:uncharacterized protein YcgI (DUF1989 family)
LKVISTVEVAAGTGEGFHVGAGQVMRIIMSHGKQVGDLTVVNANDHREGLSDNASTQLGGRSLSKVDSLWSGPPHFGRLVNIENDRTGTHFVHGRCSREMFRRFFGMEDVRGCHENIVEAFRTLGVEEKFVPFATFNVFMKVVVTPAGTYHFYPPIAEQGEFVDFRANVDLAVALSACPHPFEVNDGEPKPLTVDLMSA